MAIDATLRGMIEKAVDEWVDVPEININYIRSVHPTGNPDHNYMIGFIHGNITQYCWCLIADYFQRKPSLNERLSASRLVKRRISEIDDAITRAEELGLGDEDEYDDDEEDDFEEDEE